MYGAEVMTLTVSGGMGLIPVGGTVVTLPQLAGAFQLVAGIVTSPEPSVPDEGSTNVLYLG